MNYDTLLALHIDPYHHDYRVTTDGTGKSWVAVPYGDDLGGHIDTVTRLCRVEGWPVIDVPQSRTTLIPTYAYDRLVVAGLRV